MQDQSITESMGPMTDHSFEHLAPTDQMIAVVRRRLAQALRAFKEDPATIPCASDTYFGARSGSFWADDPQTPFADAYKTELQKATRWQPASTPRA